MKTSKYLKPNIIDPLIEKKIIKTLQAPVAQVDDYWAPTKNTFKSIFKKYIRSNIVFVIIVISIFMLLMLRYRFVKDKRERVNNTQISQTTNAANNPNYSHEILDAYNNYYNNLLEPRVKPPRAKYTDAQLQSNRSSARTKKKIK